MYMNVWYIEHVYESMYMNVWYIEHVSMCTYLCLTVYMYIYVCIYLRIHRWNATRLSTQISQISLTPEKRSRSQSRFSNPSIKARSCHHAGHNYDDMWGRSTSHCEFNEYLRCIHTYGAVYNTNLIVFCLPLRIVSEVRVRVCKCFLIQFYHQTFVVGWLENRQKEIYLTQSNAFNFIKRCIMASISFKQSKYTQL